MHLPALLFTGNFEVELCFTRTLDFSVGITGKCPGLGAMAKAAFVAVAWPEREEDFIAEHKQKT